jgi:hypothetical protein
VLLKLDLAGGFDLDCPSALGTMAEVQERIRTGLPSEAAVRFHARADGGYTLSDRALRFAVENSEPVVEVAVDVSDNHAEAFGHLRALCEQTGWTLFDRGTGRFIDLGAAAPLRPPSVSTRPFQWWTGLPSWVRIVVGLAIGWILLYSLIWQWIASWQ